MATTKQLRGKAPLTIVRTNDGRQAYVYVGKPVPNSITPEDRARLVRERFLEEVEVEVAEESSSDATGEPTAPAAELPGPGAKVAEIEAYVGDDADRARAALEQETGEGGQNRSTLVEKLEKIANPA